MDGDIEGQAKRDAIGGTTKSRQARGGNNTGVQYSHRQKDIQTSSYMSANVYGCRLSAYPLQDTVWKNWKPLVILLQHSHGRVAKYIDTLEKNSGEGTAAAVMLFFVSFACDGSCSARVSCERVFCPAVINPYTLRPLTGLHSDQMDEVLLYMVGQDAKIVGCTPSQE